MIGLSAIGAVAALVIIVLGTRLAGPVYRARRLFSEAAALRVGRAEFKDVQRIADQFRATLGAECTVTHCFLAIRVENTQLPEWWRGPGTTFGASFKIENGLLTEEQFLARTGVGVNAPYVVVVEGPHQRELPEPVFVGKKFTADDPKWVLIINLTPAAPMQAKKRYLSFNFWCLAKYRGCRDAGELLPTVDWND